MHRHSGEDRSDSHEDWHDRSHEWHHSDEDFGSHGSREHGSHGSGESDSDEHSGMGYGGKIGFGAFICIMAVIVILLVVLCCCKKKNRRNVSVSNLHAAAHVQPSKLAHKVPLQYGVSLDMPTNDAKALEVLSVPALATASAPAPVHHGPAVFGVPPPEYRSTVDMRALPEEHRDEITSPPPTYKA